MRSFMGRRPAQRSAPAFLMLAVFLILLWIAGGSARADAVGQILVRLAAWVLLCVCVVRGLGNSWTQVKPVVLILGAATALVLLQLVPLPPEIWAAMPARALVAQSAEVVGLTQPWRPLTISPAATFNALGSLVVPWATLLTAASLTRAHHSLIARLVVCLVVAGCLLGLLQFTGARFDNPLINDQSGFVSGNLSNRNHFALFVAIGILLILTLGIGSFERVFNGLPLTIFLVPFLLLIAFLTESRAGIALSVIAIAWGMISSRALLGQVIWGMSRKWFIALTALFFAALTGVGILAVKSGRVEIIDRFAAATSQDMRARSFPVVRDMIVEYFPAGSGFGTFDPTYRIAEPDALLNLLYFNHAHNDWLEIALDGGLPGIILLGVAVGWWSITTWKLLRSNRQDLGLARCGSTICLLVMAASLADYPARTPLIMSILTLAAVWMVKGTQQDRRIQHTGD